MMDTFARMGSFAAVARDLRKVPSALTWWLHQLRSPTTRQALLDQHGGLLL